MKIVMALFCLLWAGANPLWAQEAGDIGAGIILGNPTGVTAKLWRNKTEALDAGMGFSEELALYADYLWHGWNILPQPSKGKLPAYIGVGLQVRTFSPNQYGIRAVAGIAYWLPHNPIEIFLELVPVFRLSPDSAIGSYGGIGLRYYFK